MRDNRERESWLSERARAFKSLEDHPNTVEYYFEHDIIVKDEAMPYVLKVLKDGLTKVPTYLNIKNSEGTKLLTQD